VLLEVDCLHRLSNELSKVSRTVESTENELLIDNIIVMFGGRVFQQTVAIPMDTNFAPLRQFECLKSILCDIKKNLGSTVKHTRLPIIMSMLAKVCSLLHSFVFGYFKSIMLVAVCCSFFLRCGEFIILNQSTLNILTSVIL
jgi:hypothetical protein